MTTITRVLDRRGHLLLDGAMGTLLMAAGLEPGGPPEEWNATHPERVREAHLAYLEAGSELILTNSFGGNPFRLRRHGLEERILELNTAAARVARGAADEAAGAGEALLVGGSIGPSGEFLEPLGGLTLAAARDGFAAQAAGLAAGGVDLIWIETMSDLQEARAAIEGARAACDLPLVVTMSFDTGQRTMMGVTPEDAVRELVRHDLAAMGANCGSGTGDVEAVIDRMAAAGAGIPLVAKSNAGIPAWVDGEVVYDGTPETMRDHALRVRELGARLIGGCCGSGPAHIRAIGRALGAPSHPGP